MIRKKNKESKSEKVVQNFKYSVGTLSRSKVCHNPSLTAQSLSRFFLLGWGFSVI